MAAHLLPVPVLHPICPQCPPPHCTVGAMKQVLFSKEISREGFPFSKALLVRFYVSLLLLSALQEES